jgi:hypothetical protein
MMAFFILPAQLPLNCGRGLAGKIHSPQRSIIRWRFLAGCGYDESQIGGAAP